MIDWDATTIAGGFVVGVIVGSISTIRIMRWLLVYLREEQRQSRDDHGHSPD